MLATLEAPPAHTAPTFTPSPTRASSHVQLHPPGSSGREAVESFIRTVFRERFGADVQHFAPMLVSLRDEHGRLQAAAGYRAGELGPLFLERYLDQPVESLLAPAGGDVVERRRIVEVGQLAGAQAGAGRQLILQLGPHLALQGFQWVVGTLTQELRALFLRLGIAPLALGTADPSRLGDEASHWGSYYDHRPVVLAGSLDLALQALARRRHRAEPTA